MKQIIIGKSGVGKSRICVRNAVLNYSGKVILVNSYDAAEYLGLDKIGLATVLLENISEINDFEKIQVDTHCNICSMSKESKELVCDFIKKHIDDENTLLIIEETSNIAPECVNLIMSAKNLKVDVIMIFQSEEQLKMCSGDKINMDSTKLIFRVSNQNRDECV